VSGKYLIFVVDDDNEVRTSTFTLLEMSGYLVRDFRSGEDLLATGKAGEADCFVLDYNLSGITGLELVEALRNLAVTAPVIIVSANGGSLPSRAAGLGIAAVLRKPLAAEELLDWLEKVLPVRD
jgi:FixJ family two-component response regulator